MTKELEELVQANIESPEDVSEQFVDKKLGTLFRPNETHVSTIKDDGAIFVDGKRIVTTKPLCNSAVSKPHRYIRPGPLAEFKAQANRDDTWTLAGGRFRDVVKSDWRWLFWQVWRFVNGAPILADTVSDVVPEALRTDIIGAICNRSAIEVHNIKYPPGMFPDSRILPPKSRRSTHKTDQNKRDAFGYVSEINESCEPLQTNWGQADYENVYAADVEEGDAKKIKRSPDAEWEMRPSKEWWERFIANPNVQYVNKIPVSGDVECVGFHKDRVLEHEDAARKSFVKLGIEPTQECINEFVGRTLKSSLLNICDVDLSKKWTVYRIGDARFSLFRTKRFYRGAMTHYFENGGWHLVKDAYGTPDGPKDVAKAMGSNPKYWETLHPKRRKSEVEYLSPADKAKQRANKYVPVKWDEMYKAVAVYLQTNGRPANDNRSRDGLPYDVTSSDELRYAYSFGGKYANEPEAFDDVTVRASDLAAFNARLSPQTLRVQDMIVQTERTDTLAPNFVALGAALHPGRAVSERTLMRLGQKAANDAAAEILKVRQELAA